LHIESENIMKDEESLCGIIVVDKPPDMTSAGVVNRLKRLPGVRKAGHTGTLDPFATGVMVCPVNRATRLSRFFLHGPKTYRATMILGVETDTQDHTGKILKTTRPGDITYRRIESVFSGFIGISEQVPPAYSALKHKGVPLYRYARSGKPVKKPARKIHIFSLDIIDIRLPEVVFTVECSSGTYIRTLCADIGKKLGCGAHLAGLVRTMAGGFSINEALKLEELTGIESAKMLKSRVIPMADALRGMPSFTAGKKLEAKIATGRPVTRLDIGPADMDGPGGPYLKIVDNRNRLLAVVEPVENKLEYRYCCVFNST